MAQYSLPPLKRPASVYTYDIRIENHGVHDVRLQKKRNENVHQLISSPVDLLFSTGCELFLA